MRVNNVEHTLYMLTRLWVLLVKIIVSESGPSDMNAMSGERIRTNPDETTAMIF